MNTNNITKTKLQRQNEKNFNLSLSFSLSCALMASQLIEFHTGLFESRMLCAKSNNRGRRSFDWSD